MASMTDNTPKRQPIHSPGTSQGGAGVGAPGTPPPFQLDTSRQFTAWLAEQGASLAFTTYQAGRVFFLGHKPDGRLDVFNRAFARCMGLCATPQTLYLSSLYQLWRLENSLGRGESYQGYDRVYVPQLAYTTGDVDMHDIALDATGRPVFANTLFSCLATVSERYSFRPLWQPPFISKLAAEDRCHLNGLAMENGAARYVTAVSQSDVADGWREGRADKGVVIDVGSNEIVLDGLSMPHSPRLYRERLWLLDSGHGQFGYVDLERGRFEPVAFCPGYGRGLGFVGDFAIVGLSKPRHQTFSGLALDGELASKQAQARCGLLVIDLRTGDVVHWVRIEGVIEELYDVAVLPGVVCPMAIGTQSDEIRRVLSMAPAE
ncbi:MAG: TIGR03032 family protein [Pseudomonadota bacterium]|nr:TIGR03032 family protein [Pseudomonadota bacterium]